MMKLYCARWVLPVASAPLRDGAVAVEGARIEGVGARAELEERFPSVEVEDFGEAAILPGFVNCHTHLELTAMRGFLEPVEGDFFAWLRKVTIARAKIESLRGGETPLITLGLSPHAPYTVSAPLLQMLARYASDERLPLMMHAAESEAEQLLMLRGVGPFADSFNARGIVFNSPGVSTVRHLAQTGILDTRPLLAHCVRVDDADIETIKNHGASVAHCPESNA